MITVRAARWAALGAVMAMVLLVGTADSAKAAGGGGGNPPPTDVSRYFGDAPNRKHDQNLAIGWDLLDHRGWENASYGWNVSRTTRLNSDARDANGHLIASSQPGDPPGTAQNNVWSGSGQSPAGYKDIDTLSYMKSQYQANSGTCYYEYVLHWTGTKTDPNTGNTIPDNGETSGGIYSYGL